MADEQFNLGEALGSYEQAKADRDFYLSMVQGGTQAASPIAAYLAGVANVKAGQMRSEAEQIQDARLATERALKRGETLRNNLFQLAKSARGGEIAPASAATLAGAIVKEMGYTPREFDTDNLILTYSKDGEDYELDLSEAPTELEKGRSSRAKERIAWEKEKQEKGIKGQIEVAREKAKLKDVAGKGGPSVSNKWQAFKFAYGPIIESANQKNLLTDIQEYDDDMIAGFLADYDAAYGIDKLYDIVKKEADRRGLSEQPKKAVKESRTYSF